MEDLPDVALRSALEFAVGVAAAGQKVSPKLAVPAGLKPFLKTGTLPITALAKVRRAIEDDGLFRGRLAVAMPSSIVDEVGTLWLTRPDGWESRAAALVAEADDLRADAELRRERKRREGAEAAAERSRADADALRIEAERLRIDIAALQQRQRDDALAVERLRQEVAELTRARQRAVRDRTADGDDVLELRDRLDRLTAQLADVTVARDHALAHHDDGNADVVPLVRHLVAQQRTLAASVEALATALLPAVGKRSPLRLPGRVAGDLGAEAEFLMRADAEVFVDGYNVAKLAWPTLTLVQQRERCVDHAEEVARRFGTAITVVFDGAAVTGASGPRRLVKVLYSVEGSSADDLIRDRVAAAAISTAVVVVTNDRAIQVDVRKHGANVVSSDAFAALAR